MTVASDINKSGPYNGNGVTTAFDYEFRIVNEDHVQVIKTSTTGVETILTKTTHYTVNGAGDTGGGQIIMVTPPANGERLTLLRNVPFVQETDLENQGAYYAETVEDTIDLAVMRDQQLAEKLTRAVIIPVSADSDALPQLVYDVTRLADSADNIDTVADNISAVTSVANNMPDVVVVAGISDQIETIGAEAEASAGSAAASAAAAESWAGASAASAAEAAQHIVSVTPSVMRFSGDASDTTFDLGLPLIDELLTNVYISGVYQQKDTYSIVDGVLTFSSAPPTGTNNIEVMIGGNTAQAFAIPSNLTVDDSKLSSLLTIALSKVVASVAALKAVNTARYNVVYLSEAGRSGVFVWRVGDYSAAIAADTAAGVYIKADSVSETEGAWVRAFDGAVSVKWFGAKGDGTTDDLAAFVGAFAISQAVFVPDGKYLISAKVTKTLLGATDNFTLSGAGTDATVLYWPNADGGIVIEKDAPGQSWHVSSMTFTTGQVSGGSSGLRINQASPLAAYATSDIEGVTFRGDDNTGNLGSFYWETAIYNEGDCGVKYRNINIWGVGGHDTALGTGIYVVGVPALGASGYSIENMISHLTANNLRYGVLVGDLVQTVNIDQSFILNCWTGVSNSGDDCTISDTVINASEVCFVNGGPTLSPRVIGCYFEALPGGDGITIFTTDSFIVVGTFIGCPAGAANNAINIVDSNGGVISGCKISGSINGIQFNAGSGSNKVNGVVYTGVTTDILDFGSNNRDEAFRNVVVRRISFSDTSQYTLSASAGGLSLPAGPYGYLSVVIAGTPYKIPLYGS